MNIKKPRVPTRWLVGLVLIATFVPIASGAAVLTGTNSRAHTRGVLLFVGDSNVYLASMQIAARTTWLDHTDNPYIPVLASRIGATIRAPDCRVLAGCPTNNYWQIKLKTILSKIHPDAIVTNLGINDARLEGTETAPGYSYYGRKINWFMNLIPKDLPVFWTNLPCQIEPAPLLTGCHAVNDALGAARSRWSNFIMVNWGTRANGHPEYLLHPQGRPSVHDDPVGSALWIEQVIAAVDARMPAT